MLPNKKTRISCYCTFPQTAHIALFLFSDIIKVSHTKSVGGKMKSRRIEGDFYACNKEKLEKYIIRLHPVGSNLFAVPMVCHSK
jgi:hypothetical protein